MPINVGTVSIFTPFDFAVLLSSRNKGHANITGFTVFVYRVSVTWPVKGYGKADRTADKQRFRRLNHEINWINKRTDERMEQNTETSTRKENFWFVLWDQSTQSRRLSSGFWVTSTSQNIQSRDDADKCYTSHGTDLYHGHGWTKGPGRAGWLHWSSWVGGTGSRIHGILFFHILDLAVKIHFTSKIHWLRLLRHIHLIHSLGLVEWLNLILTGSRAMMTTHLKCILGLADWLVVIQAWLTVTRLHLLHIPGMVDRLHQIHILERLVTIHIIRWWWADVKMRVICQTGLELRISRRWFRLTHAVNTDSTVDVTQIVGQIRSQRCGDRTKLSDGPLIYNQIHTEWQSPNWTYNIQTSILTDIF